MNLADWSLCCPNCRVTLIAEDKSYNCPICLEQYLIQDGVVRFIQQDPFYEERYPPKQLNFSPNFEKWTGQLFLYLIGMHYFWFIKKYIPHGSRILDLASGAGMVFLAKNYKTAGLDISFSSSVEMSKIYELSLQCRAERTPISSDALDAVVSRFFFEHVPEGEKEIVLQECWRILKPGGCLIILQDCECNNPLWRWAKRDMDIFQRNIINRDGHIGLLYPSQNLALLEKAGFRLMEKYAANKTLLVTPSLFGWMQDYRQKGWMENLLLGMASQSYKHRLVNLGYSMIMTLWDDLVERFLPLDHARYLLTACRKF
jgi:ubiquinone/menaquinone biosynthesis C-methylase UbiE